MLLKGRKIQYLETKPEVGKSEFSKTIEECKLKVILYTLLSSIKKNPNIWR